MGKKSIHSDRHPPSTHHHAARAHHPRHEQAIQGAQAAITRPPSALTPGGVLALQRTVGNRAVQRMLAPHARPAGKISGPKRGGLIQRMHLKEGNVSFDSEISEFSISPQELDITTMNNSSVLIDAAAVNAKATVTATGPKQETDLWQAGFHQTISKSGRNFYYDSSKRTRATDQTDTPTKDGEDGSIFYNGKGKKFEDTGSEGQAKAKAKLYDHPYTPSSGLPLGTWPDPKAEDEGDHLHHTDGEDCFTTWLVVAKKADESSPLLLDRKQWYINWASQKTGPRTLTAQGGTFEGAGSSPASEPEFQAEHKPEAHFGTW